MFTFNNKTKKKSDHYGFDDVGTRWAEYLSISKTVDLKG